MTPSFFFDENMPPQLVLALHVLGQDVEYVRDRFPARTHDLVWLRYLGKTGKILVSREWEIRRNPAERQGILDNHVGAFLLKGKSLGRWDIVEAIIGKWRKIIELAQSEHPPYIVRMRVKGQAFQRIDL